MPVTVETGKVWSGDPDRVVTLVEGSTPGRNSPGALWGRRCTCKEQVDKSLLPARPAPSSSLPLLSDQGS